MTTKALSREDINQAFGNLLKETVQAGTAAKTTEQDQLRETALAALDELGRLTVKDTDIAFSGTKFVLPERFAGSLSGAAKFLLNLEKQEQQVFEFGRRFKYRWADGAAAFDRACMRVFGTTGLGKVTKGGFFSPDQPPILRSVPVSPTENIQVPWGEVSIPALSAVFTLAVERDQDYGVLFALHVQAPRSMRHRLEAFFDVVADELAQRSIYRGKAFTAAEDPQFVPTTVDSARVVYSQEVLAQLDANVWGLIRHTAEQRRLGMPLKRTVLLEGPYGTGKSIAADLTAQECAANGWTFIRVRPGKDDIHQALKTAQLYAPAVVHVEDLDVVADADDSEGISRILDSMDGIESKNQAVLLLATTNHVENIQRGIMRPGRVDAIVHIGHLDAQGVEKLIKATVSPEILATSIDYGRVFAALEGMTPAFVREACDRAVRYSMARNAGKAQVIDTEDIEHAANGLRRQLDLMNGATEGVTPAPTIDQAFREVLRSAARTELDDTAILDNDGDVWMELGANTDA